MNRRDRKLKSDTEQISGDGFLSELVSQELPSRFKAFMESNPNIMIVSMTINRKLIDAFVITILNFLSLGQFSRNQKKYGYDQVYHISIDMTLSDGYRYRLEKNQVIQMWRLISDTQSLHVSGSGIIDIVKHHLSNTLDKLSHTNPSTIVETMNVHLDHPINFVDFINRGIAQVGIKHFTSYNSVSNNCQSMIGQVLRGSNLYPEKVQKFVLQSAKKLLEGYEFIQPLLNANTDALAIIDRLVH